MRLPNGAGSVYKMGGNRRRPWIARKTLNYEIIDGRAKQKYKIIGYYETRRDALEALMAANGETERNHDVTVAELYKNWSAAHFPTITPGTAQIYKSAFGKFGPILDKPIADLRVQQIEEFLETIEKPGPKNRARMLLCLLQDYALKYEYISRNYAKMSATSPETPKTKRAPFSPNEIRKIYTEALSGSDMVLCAIYTGFRPGELIELLKSNVDLENMTIKGGKKTAAGRDRVVPIHPAIAPFIRANMASDGIYLFQSCFGNYYQYTLKFNSAVSTLKTKHRPHDTRHTFVTLAKEAGLNDNVLKIIVGHSVADLTERVYTHRKIEELRAELLKIPNYLE